MLLAAAASFGVNTPSLTTAHFGGPPRSTHLPINRINRDCCCGVPSEAARARPGQPPPVQLTHTAAMRSAALLLALAGGAWAFVPSAPRLTPGRARVVPRRANGLRMDAGEGAPKLAKIENIKVRA
jgi:hypothetical protein